MKTANILNIIVIFGPPIDNDDVKGMCDDKEIKKKKIRLPPKLYDIRIAFLSTLIIYD